MFYMAYNETPTEGTAVINFKPSKQSDLDKEIARLFSELNGKDPSENEYASVADQLVKLYKLKEVDSKERVSSDVLVSAAANLVGIVLIVKHEHVHIITSKALGFVGKKFGL